jgi:hypothetical protein
MDKCKECAWQIKLHLFEVDTGGILLDRVNRNRILFQNQPANADRSPG